MCSTKRPGMMRCSRDLRIDEEVFSFQFHSGSKLILWRITMIAKTQVVEQGPTIDFGVIKQRQQQTWGSGDFDKVAVLIMMTGELLCEAVDLHPGQDVLDVACGSGNAAISAARRFGK